MSAQQKKLGEEQQKLVEDNVRLVGFVVTRIALADRQMREELMGEGALGLCDAALTYDPNREGEKKAAFSTYAVAVIRNRLRKHLGKRGVAQDVLADTELADPEPDPEAAYLEQESAQMRKARLERHRRKLEKLIARSDVLITEAELTEDEANVLRLRWGLDRGCVPRTRAEVAEELVSRNEFKLVSEVRRRGRLQPLQLELRLTEASALAKVRARRHGRPEVPTLIARFQ